MFSLLCLGCPVIPRTAEYPRPDHFLLHLSDTHLLAGDGSASTASSTANATCASSSPSSRRPAAAPRRSSSPATSPTRAKPDAYEPLRAIVEPVAARLGAQVIWVDGQPRRPRRVPPRAARRAAATEPPGRPCLRRQRPAHHHARLHAFPATTTARSPAQPARLARRGALDPAPHGTILAMHHPPVPSVLDLAVTVELRDQATSPRCSRAATSAPSSPATCTTRSTATFAGIPVSVASATCYTQDLNVPGRRHPRPRRRAGVQPRARLRRHGAALGGADRPVTRRSTTSTPRETERAARRASASASRIRVRPRGAARALHHPTPPSDADPAFSALTCLPRCGEREVALEEVGDGARALLDRDLGHAAVVEAEEVVVPASSSSVDIWPGAVRQRRLDVLAPSPSSARPRGRSCSA